MGFQLRNFAASINKVMLPSWTITIIYTGDTSNIKHSVKKHAQPFCTKAKFLPITMTLHSPASYRWSFCRLKDRKWLWIWSDWIEIVSVPRVPFRSIWPGLSRTCHPSPALRLNPLLRTLLLARFYTLRCDGFRFSI